MSLIQDIKAYQLQARKLKHTETVKVLTTLIGEAEMIGKNDGNRETKDAEVIALIKKFIKNLDEVLSVVPADSDAATTAKGEQLILSKFLPKQLDRTEMESIVKTIIIEINATSSKDMGKVMKMLKERFEGQYDGAVASSIIKDALK